MVARSLLKLLHELVKNLIGLNVMPDVILLYLSQWVFQKNFQLTIPVKISSSFIIKKLKQVCKKTVP